MMMLVGVMMMLMINDDVGQGDDDGNDFDDYDDRKYLTALLISKSLASWEWVESLIVSTHLLDHDDYGDDDDDED